MQLVPHTSAMRNLGNSYNICVRVSDTNAGDNREINGDRNFPTSRSENSNANSGTSKVATPHGLPDSLLK